MAIQFHCHRCNQLLQTPDGTTGEQAKCSDCGATVTIPPRSESIEAADDMRPVGLDDPVYGGSPFASRQSDVPGVLDSEQVLRHAWRVFKNHWPRLFGVFFLAQLLVFGWLALIVVPILKFSLMPLDVGAAISAWIVLAMGWLAFVAWIHIGLAQYHLRLLRGEPAVVRDLFGGIQRLPRVLGLMILLAPLFAVGYAVCLVPGVILFLVCSQSFFLLVDQDVDILESLQCSWRLTAGNRVAIFVVYFWMGLIGWVSTLCPIFLVPAYPFLALVPATMYLMLSGQTMVATRDRVTKP